MAGFKVVIRIRVGVIPGWLISEVVSGLETLFEVTGNVSCLFISVFISVLILVGFHMLTAHRPADFHLKRRRTFQV